MAMINCPECSKEVSDKAATCPNCGIVISLQSPLSNSVIEKSPLIDKVKMNKFSNILVSVITVIIIVGLIIGTQVRNNNIERARIAEEQRIAEEARIAQYESDITYTAAFIYIKSYPIADFYLEAIRDYCIEPIANGVISINDFNRALRILHDTSVIKELVANDNDNNAIISSLMSNVANPPTEFQDAYTHLQILYNAYSDMSNILKDTRATDGLEYSRSLREACERRRDAGNELLLMLPNLQDVADTINAWED